MKLFRCPTCDEFFGGEALNCPECGGLLEQKEVHTTAKRGRPLASPTGERRQEWRISVAPSARKRAEELAQAEGLSPSAWVEKLILGKLSP